MALSLRRLLLHRPRPLIAAATLSSLIPNPTVVHPSPDTSWLSSPGDPLIRWPSNALKLFTELNPTPRLSVAEDDSDLSAVSELFMDPRVTAGPSLHAELDRAGVHPSSALLSAVFERFDSRTMMLYSLFLWAMKKPGFQCSPEVFGSMITALAELKAFDLAWSLILDRLAEDEDGSGLISVGNFVVLIRRYVDKGMVEAAIRTFEFARTLTSTSILGSDSDTNLFEELMVSLCKAREVHMASIYIDEMRRRDPSRSPPSAKVYNSLMAAWFKSGGFRQGERVWIEMKKDKVRPTVVTFGILAKRYCQHERVESAIELVTEMKGIGIEPNAIVFDVIINALAFAGRFQEALRMMERFSLLEEGPTISTYNSLVQGFCMAGDVCGASEILKTMIGNGILPTATTYSYFFSYFTKEEKIEDAMNLYSKIVDSGYIPEKSTYKVLVTLLCKNGWLDLAANLTKEMIVKGHEMDVTISMKLIQLYFVRKRFEEGVFEFENVIKHGRVPPQHLLEKVKYELKKLDMFEIVDKLDELVSSVSGNNSLLVSEKCRAKKLNVIRSAKTLSALLKSCKDPTVLAEVKLRHSSHNIEWRANRLAEEIRMTRPEDSRY